MNKNLHFLVAVCLVCFFGTAIMPVAWAGGNDSDLKEHKFLTACRDGDLEGARYYLQLDGFDINHLYSGGEKKQLMTGLFLAAGYGHHAVVKMLLNAGADPNVRAYNGKTPLINASGAGHESVIDTLIASGADVNAVTDNNDSAIYVASKGGHDQLVKRLMVAGALHPMGDASKPVLKNTWGEHEFLAACREGHITVVRYYLTLNGFDINQLYSGGEKKQLMTGLFLAAGYGHHAVVKMLLNAGADPNVRAYNGKTPLINASGAGHESVIDTLIASGADVNAVTDNNDSAIYVASKGGHDQLVKRLMVAGALHPMGDASKPVLKNTWGEHEFLAACREGHITVVRYYLTLNGFDINQLYSGGEKKQLMTGLYLAAGYGQHTVAKMLLNAGADPNVRVYSGKTPLINAAQNSHGAVIDILIASGADVNAVTNDNESAIYIASIGGYDHLVQRLMDAGARHPMGDASKPVLKNTWGEHEFLAACREGHLPAIRYYLQLDGFDINQLYSGGEKTQLITGLYLAAGYGQHTVVKMLLNAGADPNVRVYSGKTPLINAAQYSHGAVIDTLIASGADVNAVTGNNDSAIYVASIGGYDHLVQRLMDAGARHPMEDASKPVLKNRWGEHEFLAACREGHLPAIRYYLQLDGFDINQLYSGGENYLPYTGLYLAAGYGQHTVVKMLLNAGADPNVRVCSGKTPLINAAQNSHGAVIDTLIASGADVNAVTDDNESAIYVASIGGYDQLVLRLMDAGARHPMEDASKPVLKNTWGEHEFLAACREGHLPAIRYYIQLDGFAIDQLYSGGEKKRLMTGLYLAAGYGQHAVVKMLLNAGADPNVRVYSGNTPLINAATNGHEAVVNTLIENGADMQHASDSVHSALIEAAKGGYYKVVSLLLEKGIAPYNRIQEKSVGKKALSEARKHEPSLDDRRSLHDHQNYKVTKEVLTQAIKARDHDQVRSWRSRIQHAGANLYERITSFSREGSADERQSLIDPMAKLSVYNK